MEKTIKTRSSKKVIVDCPLCFGCDPYCPNCGQKKSKDLKPNNH